MRIGFSLIAILLIIIAPYWFYLGFLLVGIIIFPLYLEALIFALMVDVVYGGAGHGAMFFGFPFGISATLLILLAIPLRKYIRFHA